MTQRLLVFNKVDRLTHAEEEALRDRVRALESAPAVFVSALQDAVARGAAGDAQGAHAGPPAPTWSSGCPPWDGEALARALPGGRGAGAVGRGRDGDGHRAASPGRCSRACATRPGIDVEEVA